MRKTAFILTISATLFSYDTFLIDQYGSPSMGAYDLTLIHSFAVKVDDQYFQHKPNISFMDGLTRFSELTLFGFINSYIDVAQHEVFGHGYRIRENSRYAKVAGYIIDFSSGATQYSFDTDMPFGINQLITTGGLEGESILAHQMKMKWIEEKKIDARGASMYPKAQLSPLSYALVTTSLIGDNASAEDLEGNDINDYINNLSALYPSQFTYLQGATGINNLFLFTAISLLDPSIYYVTIGNIYYIYTGKTWPFTMIPLTTNLSFLPNARAELAPYGPEAYLETYFSYKGNPIHTYLKGGVNSIGAGIEYPALWMNSWGVFGFKLQGWKHAPFVLQTASYQNYADGLPVSMEGQPDIIGFGGSLLTRFHKSGKSPISFFSEIGVKSYGYSPGNLLNTSLEIRLGITN